MLRKGKRLSPGPARPKQWTINEGRILELERGAEALGSQKPLIPVMGQLCKTYNLQGRPTSCASRARMTQRSNGWEREWSYTTLPGSTSDESHIPHPEGRRWCIDKLESASRPTALFCHSTIDHEWTSVMKPEQATQVTLGFPACHGKRAPRGCTKGLWQLKTV